VCDAQSNLYVSDSWSRKLLKITAAGRSALAI
jgi:hypothetical protein